TVLPLISHAQPAKKSTADLAREGAIALAMAHSEKPRYGGKFISVGNEKIPLYDMHQTSLGGVYAVTAPAYNGLLRTSPYDPLAREIMPELAHTWELSDGGKTVTFHLHKGVKWHDGAPFTSADVKYTIERIMKPPQGMVSPRGPVFNAVIERVEAPDEHTVVVYGKGPSPLLLDLFANGHNAIIPKHIVEKDPVNALKTQVIGTGPFRLKETPTTTLWRYERNPDYFQKDRPFLDELEIHIIDDPQAMVAALLSKRIHWTDAFLHPNMDGDLAKSAVQQNNNLIHGKAPGLIVAHLSMQSEKPPFDDVRVRQAFSHAIRRESIQELGNQSGSIGTGVYPLGPWAMSKAMREQLIGYSSDMNKRLAQAKELLASYEKEKGKIDWSKIKIQCSTNIKFSCENAQILQQMLKKANVNLELDPMLVTQNRGNEVSGDYQLSSLGAAFDFDDPIDTFGQLFVTKGGRWYQKRSIPEVDKLYEQQKFIADPEERKKVIWAMDQTVINDSAYLILHWYDLHHVRWNFVKGWSPTPNIRSTNARMDTVWLDWPELPHSR
ncbi:MAG: ABC transporter substrate-binding protein, partial [Candidatus Tectomicrobia bacterium]|nr:ABC transporter substrate-binding protein [Candidatus Tectomicrobia bacterium]